MKKILATALLLAATTYANATDWVNIGSNATTTAYVDADRIKYHNQALDQRVAWVKIKYKHADGIYRAGEYTLANQIIDCRNSRFSVKTIVSYTSGGQVKDTQLKQTGWMDIPPDTNFDYVAETICSYPYI